MTIRTRSPATAASCLSTDPTRDCTPADACAGQGTCDDTTHTCTPGTALVNNTPCGTGGYCWAGTCTQPDCGDGDLEPGETCDNGALNGTPGNGCTSACTYACVTPATDCGAEPACQTWTCSPAHACQAVADATQNGDACGSNMVCSSGVCTAQSAVCGNGAVEGGEQCDFGAGNGANTGCETNCAFSCTMAPNSCDDGAICNGAETCATVMVSEQTGQACAAGTPPIAGTSCGLGSICLAQACVTSACGDGFVHAGSGETCEPPGTATCDAACHVCGETTARSLDNVQLASAILTYCTNYTISNTMLDIYVGGCNYLLFIPVVRATQPDGARTGNDVYRFQADATRQVNACTKNGAPAVLSECLANATYSSYYSFGSGRVIAK